MLSPLQRAVFLTVACTIVIGTAAPARAQASDERPPARTIDRRGDLISVFSGDIHIPADRRQIGTVTCVGGDVRVEGEVTGDVVVIWGGLVVTGEVGGDTTGVLTDVEVREAEISGDLVSVLGSLSLVESTVRGEMVNVLSTLDRDRLSRIAGEFVNIGLGSWAPSFSALLMWLRLFHKFVIFVLLLLLVALVPERIRAIGDEAPLRFAAAFFVGLLGYLGLLVLTTLLSITLVGIPVVLFAFYVFKWLGIAGIFFAIGRRLGRVAGLELSTLGAILTVFALYVLSSVLPAALGVAGLLVVLTLRMLFFVLIEIPAVGLVLLTLAGGRPGRIVAEQPGLPAVVSGPPAAPGVPQAP